MPKGKKKGSKKKLKNMTDEERVLYMEQKMLLEAEAKKKKEDLLNELLKVSFGEPPARIWTGLNGLLFAGKTCQRRKVHEKESEHDQLPMAIDHARRQSQRAPQGHRDHEPDV